MKLVDQVRHKARVKHFSYRTAQAYVHWIVRYIRFFGVRHPNLMGTAEVEVVISAAGLRTLPGAHVLTCFLGFSLAL